MLRYSLQISLWSFFWHKKEKKRKSSPLTSDRFSCTFQSWSPALGFKNQDVTTGQGGECIHHHFLKYILTSFDLKNNYDSTSLDSLSITEEINHHYDHNNDVSINACIILWFPCAIRWDYIQYGLLLQSRTIRAFHNTVYPELIKM